MRDKNVVVTFLDQLLEKIPMYALFSVQIQPFTPLNNGHASKWFAWNPSCHFVGVWPSNVSNNFQSLLSTSSELFSRIMALGPEFHEDTLLRTPCGVGDQTSRGRGGLAIVHKGELIESTVGLNSSFWDEAFALLALLYGLGNDIIVTNAEGGLRLPTSLHIKIHGDDFAKGLFKTVLGSFSNQDLTRVEVPSHIGKLTLNVAWQ